MSWGITPYLSLRTAISSPRSIESLIYFERSEPPVSLSSMGKSSVRTSANSCCVILFIFRAQSLTRARVREAEKVPPPSVYWSARRIFLFQSIFYSLSSGKSSYPPLLQLLLWSISRQAMPAQGDSIELRGAPLRSRFGSKVRGDAALCIRHQYLF